MIDRLASYLDENIFTTKIFHKHVTLELNEHHQGITKNIMQMGGFKEISLRVMLYHDITKTDHNSASLNIRQ